MLSAAESVRHEFSRRLANSRNCVVDYLSGNWDEFDELEGESPDEISDALCSLARYQKVDVFSGEINLAGATGSDSHHPDATRALWSLAFACMYKVTGGKEIVTNVEAIAKAAIANPELPPVWERHAQAALAIIAVQEGDSSIAAEKYPILKPQSNTVPLSGAICSDRLLRRLAHRIDNLDEAQSYFDDAIAFCSQAGYRTELAWSLHDYAVMLVESSRSCDVVQASDLLEQSLAISKSLGMNPLSERIAALEHTIDSMPQDAPQNPAGLTDREVEVLRLVAAGKSNREIGAELFISFNTVSGQVSNIFSKTGSPNRV